MGKCLKSFLRFPGFETYVPHEKEEEHIEDVITESEINALQKKEMKFKEKQKRQTEKEMGKRKRAKTRTKNLK